jgi:hypothetical protein
MSDASGLKIGQSDQKRNYAILAWFHKRCLLKNERRTSNIERPTSNNEFCQFNKRLSAATPSFRIPQSLWGVGPYGPYGPEADFRIRQM